MSIVVQTYLDDGRVFSYEVVDAAKGREHAAAIVSNGYRHNPGKDYLEHYGPQRVLKVKLVGDIPTSYPDKVSGT